MNTGSCYQQVSLIHSHDLLIIPSPSTPVTPDIALARYPLARQASPLQGSGLRLSLAGSPVTPAESSSSSYGRVVHLPLLPTPPHGDAVRVGYRPESVCLKGTYTPQTTRALRRTGADLQVRPRQGGATQAQPAAGQPPRRATGRVARGL